MGGDKIVLLDGAGANGGGAATNGLLSMIPGMFANLIGGNKMDPNLVAALMNGRNNQDGFGGANGWWLWIIVLFWLWGGRGFGNGFGNGGDCCANGLPAQLNNDYGRELLMQAIQGNRSAIDQIASALNCSTTNVAVTGAAMVNGTERLLYFNKVRGVLRLMDCCVPVAAAQASEVKAGK